MAGFAVGIGWLVLDIWPCCIGTMTILLSGVASDGAEGVASDASGLVYVQNPLLSSLTSAGAGCPDLLAESEA